jgi:hypothetical protein
LIDNKIPIINYEFFCLSPQKPNDCPGFHIRIKTTAHDHERQRDVLYYRALVDNELHGFLYPDEPPLIPVPLPADMLYEKGLAECNGAYRAHCGNRSDINEHLPVMLFYALSVNATSCCEMGARAFSSTWAFCKALSGSITEDEINELNKTVAERLGETPLVYKPEEPLGPKSVRPRQKKRVMYAVDLKKGENEPGFRTACEDLGISYAFFQENSRSVSLPEPCDTLLIDTWHCYGQLLAELRANARNVRHFIFMHDTALNGDGITSESWRYRHAWNIPAQAAQNGFTIEEVETGLKPAIKKFLEEQNEWVEHRVLENNNGLTVLRRIVPLNEDRQPVVVPVPLVGAVSKSVSANSRPSKRAIK